jgi:tetratricopeptide (TPR) repeat protein
MKNSTLLFITILSDFSFNCMAQKSLLAPVNNKVEETHIIPRTQSKTKPVDQKTAKSYHVEENISSKFGGHTTTYDVLDPKHINTSDLGPKNTRIVTPLVAKQRGKLPENQSEIVKDTLAKQPGYAYIVILKTYERVAEKGYRSVDMFQKLGNGYYFNAEYKKAVRWYGELFAMNSDLEPEYYYRYAQSLKATGQNDEANKMLEIFYQKAATGHNQIPLKNNQHEK